LFDKDFLISYLLTNENYPMNKDKSKKIILGYYLGVGIDFNKLINKNIFLEIK
jgi:hypothetical protein